jgi:hypothetical protein
VKRPAVISPRFTPALVLAAIGGLDCASSSGFSGECSTNDQCPVGAYCKRNAAGTGGLCACRTDEACQTGEVCNTQGVCQKRSACRSNAECQDTSKFCDTVSGQCIDRTACGSDVHCLPGTICLRGACADGCLTSADCPLYSICDRSAVTSTSALGHCLSGKCDDKSFCDYGDRCTNNACAKTNDPYLCNGCNPQDPNACGPAVNYCLINSSYDPSNPRTGTPSFCGIDCKMESDCPNGYICGGVILLTQDQCTSDANCGGGGRICIKGENETRGFCTCVQDDECNITQAPPSCMGAAGCQWPMGRACTQDQQCDPLPICADLGLGGKVCVNDFTPCNTADDCVCSGGRCAGTGRPCSTANDCHLTCVGAMSGGGGCLLGSACAPKQGLLCPDLR